MEITGWGLFKIFRERWLTKSTKSIKNFTRTGDGAMGAYDDWLKIKPGNNERSRV